MRIYKKLIRITSSIPRRYRRAGLCATLILGLGCGDDAGEEEVCTDFEALEVSMNPVLEPDATEPVSGIKMAVVDGYVYVLGRRAIYRAPIGDPIPRVFHEFVGAAVEFTVAGDELHLFRHSKEDEDLERGEPRTIAFERLSPEHGVMSSVELDSTWIQSDLVLGDYMIRDEGYFALRTQFERDADELTPVRTDLVRMDLVDDSTSAVAGGLPHGVFDILSDGARIILVSGSPDDRFDRAPSTFRFTEIELESGDVRDTFFDNAEGSTLWSLEWMVSGRPFAQFSVPTGEDSAEWYLASFDAETGEFFELPSEVRNGYILSAEQRIIGVPSSSDIASARLYVLSPDLRTVEPLGCWDNPGRDFFADFAVHGRDFHFGTAAGSDRIQVMQVPEVLPEPQLP